ncbi:Calx-beta domain-containing protein [Paradesertivirga mongoliensis]|uniref:Calx-beta domain-containing protein n=1 Tax=Paradesertivirga mongoliensis TaxID=2100740 RepID=UPI00210A960C|nr:Calx-beta domain-containing protein [Pedobacter mongoliensis]
MDFTIFDSFKRYVYCSLPKIWPGLSGGLIFLFFLISSQHSFAEGSKELNPDGGHRVYLYTSTTTTGSLPWASQGLVRVYVQAGETINVGSSVQGLNGNGTMILVSPNGNIYTSGTAATATGLISTRAQEMAGPLPNAGGYTPYKVTAQASEAGVWSVFFVGSNGTNSGTNTPDERLSANAWDQPNNSPYIAAFDVSVRNAANTAFIPGRAYMNLLEGTMGDFDAKFTGKVNVLTNDGYIYDINANGLAGNAFAFFSNNKGFKSGGNPSYLSQDGTSVATIHPPLSEDTATDITHKLFFNTPAADLPASAPARTTTGLSADNGSATTTWLKTTPIAPTLTNFSFIGKEGTANQAGALSTMGGYFSFVANQTGNYSLKIDANKDGDYTDASDRIITNAAIAGTNTVFWDGLDGAGVPVVGSYTSSSVQVVLRAGEVHFPLLDVENNPSGIIITRTNGVGSGDQTVYWNDSNISSTTNPSSPLNTSVNGTSSSTNGHKWGSTGYNSGSFGNDKGLDTWTYVFSTPVTPATPIEFLQANLEVLPITKSKTTGICIGQQQTYIVSVRNNGPSAVSDAKFSFTFPAELTGVVITPVLTSGTASVVSSNIVGSQYNASLNMNNASVLTFTITGTVSTLPALNTLTVKATVMRPADVYDPDATNPDADIPTDPQLECDSAPSGSGCNNIQSDSTPVLISNISIANVSKAEGSGGSNNMILRVTASPVNTSCDITVNYAVTNGITNSSDFAGAITGTVTIPKDSTGVNIGVPIATDQIIEANETFTVTLTNPSSGGVITTGTATGTILDDDNIPVNKLLVITGTDGAEGVSPGATFTIGFPTGITADKDTEIQYTLTGTATGGGTDYTGLTTGTIIIPALTNSITITLPVIDDVVLEGNETVIVTTGTITTPYTGISVSNSPVTLNIADDDNAILISGPAQVVEGNNGVTYVTFRVSLDITTSSSFTIDYLTEDGVATSADNDYVAKSGTLTFTGSNPGEYFDIQIAINGDLKIEGNEAFKVKLDNLSNDFGGLLTISGSPATMSILDDDNNAANKTITITKVDGAEGGAPAEFIFSFPSGVSTDAATTINYTLSGVAVGNGTDYNGSTTGTVTIAAGANSGSFTRTVVDDLIIEDSEDVTVTTGTVTNSKYNGIGVSNSPFPLNILDNDNTTANNTITLSTVGSGSEPSSNGQFMVSYPAGIVRSTPTTVNYSIAGTAANGTDYTTLSGSVIIPANTNSAPIYIAVLDDQIIEPTETVSLTLTSATSGSVSLNVTPGVQSINITDNDNIPANNVITLNKASDAEEGLVDGQFKVSFPLGYTSSVATTVNYAITGTATNGTDYTSLTGQVIIPAGANSADIDILVNDDLIIESTETVSLGLSSATNSISALSVNPLTTVTADLRDNDNIAGNSIITLTKVSDGAEPGTNVEFLVSYPAGVTSAAATTVNYLISGTALNGTDYATLATSVTIPAGANSAPIIATVSDDQLIEATETIVLTLTTATSSISVPGLTVSPVTGVSADIIDDENTPANTKIVLTKTADGAEPGTKAQFTFSYPSGITNSAPTIVNYIVGGTAVNGTDYTLPDNTTITIPANTNSVVMDAIVSDDLIIEPTETITIDLITASSSTISAITLEPVGAVTANIDDNDNTLANKTISISKVDGVEGMLNGSFTFSFPAGIKASAPTDITFYLTGTADGSGTDYTASPSAVTITIPAGQNSVTLPLLVLEDDIIEDVETVTLTTTGVSNTDLPGIVVANSPQTLNISDNDDNTTLTVSNATVTEGNSGFVSMNFTVSLAKATGRSFSVKYTTEDGTATSAGNDYLSKQDVLNFSGMPGESFTVSVQVRGDQMIEMNEAFKLKLYDLSDPFGGRLTFASSTATGTITDDDLIPANTSITITQTNGSETGPVPASFTFSFPTGVSADAPTTINFGLSGTATGIDYTGAGSSSVTIPAGDNSFTLSLPVIDDTLIENTETVILTSGSVSSPYGITVANSPQSLEIADNDNATLVISGATVAEGNSGTTTLSFTVTLDKATGSPFTVDYATSGGTATAGNDYTAKSGTLSFNGTAGSQTIVVSVTGDQKIEPHENFTIAISNLSSSFGNRLTIPAAGSTATGTITNDDSGVITITPTDGMEAGLVPGTFTFSFPAGVTVDAPTTVSYTLSGTAESGNDYTGAISGSVEIPAKSNSITLTLPVLADLVVEDTETVILTTGIITSPYAVTVGNSPQSLDIIDKDQAVLSLTGPATITEGDSGSQLATYTVTLNQATAGSFTVDYASSNGTASIADNDYESSSGRLTFAGTAGETETFTVQINGDQKIEADENFSVVLSNLISSFSNKPVVQSTPVVTSIKNDDSGVITITSTNGSETGPVPGTFTFSLPDGVTADAATVIYTGLTGTAIGIDYTGAGTSSVTIPIGENSFTLTLPVINDALAENTETIILTTGSVDSPYGITVANSPQSLDIADNDNATLSISGASIAETNSGTTTLSFTVTLDKDTGAPFTVDYVTANGTATVSDNDYVAASGSLTFNGTAGSQPIVITVKGDQKVELDENFTVTLSNLSSNFDNRLSIPVAGSTATGTINNDDTGVITITSTNGSETGPVGGSFIFSFPAGVSMDAPTTINYTLSGTAESTKDYTEAISGSVTIPATETSVVLPLGVLDDAVVEDTETIILTAGTISSPYTVTIANSPQSLNIIDNDQAAVTLTGQSTITEGNDGTQTITYTATLNKATQSGFTVEYATADGTATLADNDYESGTGILTFAGAAGETKTFTVVVNGDKKIEADEEISVALSNLVSSLSNRPVIQTTPVVTTIENDDSGIITITSTNGSETGPVSGTFTFSFPTDVSSDAPTTINFGLTGTATAVDYTGAGTSSIIIPAGENSITLTLPVTNDALIEGTESIILTTGAVSTPYALSIANSPQSLNITDNDNATLTVAGETKAEGDAGNKVLNFTVTLDKETGTPFTVDYITSDGTAKVSDDDYTAKSGTLSFSGAAGESRIVAVSITGDEKIEADENFTLALSNLSKYSDAIVINGSPATGIIDNDDTGVITITPGSGLETGPVPGSFTFSLPAGMTMDAPVTINYTLSGTAESVKDYTGAISGSVTIDKDENSFTLTIPVVDDAVIEDTETVVLSTGTITSLYPLTIANSPQIFTITDNDQATVTLTGQPTIAEGNSGSQLITYTVTLDKATQGSFTVDYATTNGTALLADDDYESSSGRLAFAGTAGETKTFTVQINGDQKIETDENFSVSLSNLISSLSNIPVVQTTPVVTTIENDDSGIITITYGNGSETGPVPGTFTFSFPTGVSSDTPTTINFGLSGTATGMDYTGAGTSSITIPIGGNSTTLTLPVINDLIAEGKETVILTTGTVSSPYGITVANSPQSLEIADNDNASLSISGTTVVEGNSGTTAMNFTVTLDKATRPFSVNYATSDGTATTGTNDYVAASGTLNFAGTAGESKTITVTVTGDGKVEADETLSMTISDLSDAFDGRLNIATNTATGTITNDDSGVITITSTDGMEAGLVPGTFTFSFPAGVTIDVPTTINYSLSGTAESGKDYTGAISGSVTIPANTNSYELSLPVLADLVVEDTETIILTTGIIGSPYTVTVDNSPESLNITDKDQAVLSLTGPATITEGDNGSQLATYTVTLNQATTSSFKVDYATANGTATLADDDYESSSGTLEFAGTAGETETFTVQINGDKKIEADDNFSVKLSNVVGSFSNLPIAQSAPVVTNIKNDDSGIITITSSNGSETGPVPGTFTFSFPAGVTSDAATIVYFGLTGTAISADYSGAGTLSVTIPANGNSAEVVLGVNDDLVIEGTETVVLTTGAIDSPYGITVANTSQSLNIADNDNATLSLAGATITEGDSGTKVISFTVTLDKATSPFSVDYATSDGTATIADSDYTPGSGTLNFAGTIGESKTVAIAITGDKKIEVDESFTMTLSNLSDHYNNTLVIDGSPAMGIIGNDDTGVITVTPGNGSETGPTPGTFTFSLPAGTTTGAPITINYTLSGTAESAKDYTGAISGSVIIGKDQNSTTLTLPVIDDGLVEDTETVTLSAGIVSSPYILTVGNSPQSFTISDNDQATITLTGQPAITEGNTGTQLITYTATLDKATQGSFTVDYATANGSASIADNDYESSSGRLTFAGTVGETKTFTVQINGDGKIEADENFSVTLSNLISSSSNRPVVQSVPVVTTIENDDSGTITITSENGSETGPVPASFTFSFPTGVSADAPTTINFGLSGTATGIDYTGAGSSSVTIPAGDNSFTLSLPVIDDTLIENTETVILTSGSVSSPYGITVANSPQSLEIADNDNATLVISGATVAEGNSGTTTLSFTVTLDKATGSPFTVDYATSGGTATAGNDYTAKSGTLSFNGTAGSQTIVVSVTGDQKIEPHENFTIAISNLSSSFGNRLTIPAAGSTATGTITNDDSGVITITPTDGMEAGLVPGTFTFSFPAGVTVDAPTTVSYTLSGTAESGNDYTGAISGSVEIPANSNSITLTLPVLADLVVEDTETVILTTGIITSPYAVTVGNSPQSLDIIDKDQAVLSLTGPATITEGDSGSQLATYTVTLNQATAGSFTVDYASSNGTASIADNDYESSSGRLTFAGTAGETETFTVQINGDQKIEADENFSVVLSNLISSFSNKPVVQSTPVVTSIKNDDSGVITITSTNGSETGPVPGTFTFSLPDGVTADAATVIYYGLSGTALGSGTNYDYTAIPGIGSITIPANSNSATLTLNVNDDAVIEGTETAILTAGSLNSPYDIVVVNSPQSLDIADNDNAILSLTGGTVIEGNSGTQVLSFTVTLDKATSPFSVDYKTSDGSATIADNDYSALSGTLNFGGSAGESKVITVSITGDQKIEANENLAIELINLSNHYNNTLVISGSPATGTIIDDDNTVSNKSIIVTTVNGAEGGANASMKFSFPDGVSSDGITSIPYTLGGTAQDNGIDYNIASTGILYIPAGKNSVTLDLAISDDPFIEGTETAIVNAGIISNDKYTGLTLSNAPQTIFIADNDVASLSIAGPVTITEGNNGSQKAVFNVMLDKATGSGFSISYSTADGTALAADNDYIAVSNGAVVFEGKAGEVQKIEISIIGDKKIELNENYQVRLTGLSSDFGGALTFSSTSATGTIIDDDNNSSNRQITISKSDGTEGAADGSFTFSLPAGITLDAPTTINYTLSGTAKGAGIDYSNSQVGSLVIKAGENYAVLTIDVVDDSGLEPSETVIVNTGAVTNNSYNGLTVLNSPHALNIEDDDNASISISGPVQVTEGNAGTINAVFRVTLNNSTGDPFTVNYTTKDGTATVADNDYIASSGTLTFSGVAGEFENITVPVRGDLKIEKNERFTVELNGLSNDFDQRLLITGLPGVGTIRDDDNTAANRRIIISRVNGAEGGNDARFKFSFQAGVSADDWTILNYTLSGTALGDGADYAAASKGSVTIPPGENSAVLDLAVIDDAVIEATETVILTAGTIENNSHTGLNTNNSPLSLNITDNDEGELKLSGPVLVQEGNSGPTLATFSVTLLGATGSPFSIGYATFDGTAKASDDDYVTKAANLNFQGIEGEVQTITILVNGDYKIESDEEFNLILRNLSNTFGDKLKFSGLPVKGRILNDDNGTITITKTDGKEGAGGGIFTFTLPTGVYSDKPIVIPYNLSGTALGNTVDYLVNTTGSVTIPAGLSKANLNLVINDDSIIEPAEIVKISTGIVLSSMPNAVLVENSPVELTIDDNDTAPIVITNPVIVKEGNSGYVTAVFSATLPLATAEGFTFDYATADETAKTGDDDYVASTGKLTFAGRAGEVQKISVQIKGDVKVEGDEKYLINLDNLSNTYNGRLSFEFPSVTGVIHDDDIAPAAVSDFATTPEDVPVTFSLTANDNDPDGIDPTSIVIKTPPAKGEVKVNRDGTVTYTPAPDDNGMHQFTYTVKDLTGLESNEANVTVTVTPVSDPPIAEDDSFYVLKNGTLRENVSSNDADPDGEAIRFKVTAPPSNGTLVSFNETDGSFIYTPTEDFTGLDQFTYQVADAGGLTDDAVVTLGVQPKTKVKLSPTLVSVKEGEVVKITAELSEPLLQDVNLTIEYRGDAEIEKDYTLSGDFTSFLIKAGDTATTQELVLTTVRDYVKEGDEVAEVNIATATPSLFVEIESGSEVTITELLPADKPVGPDENGDIAPDPYTSPNGDGLGNESFVIQNITKYPDNEVVIFNRWGNEVFRVKGYDNKEKAFTGVANAGLFVNKDSVLPDGVYYFIIHTKVDNVAKLNKGYVIIKR